MVQCRIKHRSFVGGSAIHLDAAELLVPSTLVGSLVGIEVKGLRLRGQVCQRTIGVAKAEGYVDIQFLHLPEVGPKHGDEGDFLLDGAVGKGVLPGDFRHLVLPNEGLIEGHGEVHMLFLGPVVRNPMAHNGAVVHGLDSVVDQLVPVRHVNDQHQGVCGILEAVAVNAHPGRGGQFHVHAMVVHRDAVPSGVGRLGRFAERTCATVTPRVGLLELGARHEQNVSVVADARALQMGVTEPVHAVVCVVVATTAVPSLKPGVRTQLNHAKGRSGPWVGVSVSSRPDEGVHLQVKWRRGRGARGQEDEKRDAKAFHEIIQVCRRRSPCGCVGQNAAPLVWQGHGSRQMGGATNGEGPHAWRRCGRHDKPSWRLGWP